MKTYKEAIKPHKITKIINKMKNLGYKIIAEKYTAWAKYSEKYTTKQVLTEIIADLKWLESQEVEEVNPYLLDGDELERAIKFRKSQ